MGCFISNDATTSSQEKKPDFPFSLKKNNFPLLAAGFTNGAALFVSFATHLLIDARAYDFPTCHTP